MPYGAWPGGVAGCGKRGGDRRALVRGDPRIGGARSGRYADARSARSASSKTVRRWTTKSTRSLAAELAGQGRKVSADTVGDLLRAEGFSLQGNTKTVEGKQHPDRDLQFRYINEQARAHQGTADPVISVDTKKKELVGEFANAGRAWQPEGLPGGRAGARLPRGRPRQGGALRHLRHHRERRLGQCRHRPRHRRLRRRVSPPLVEDGRAGRVPAGPAAAHHRRRGRVQRLPHPGLEGRAGRPGRWRPGCRSPPATSRREHRSGTRSSTGCSPTSR